MVESKRLYGAALAVLIGIGAAACGGDASSESGTPEAQAAQSDSPAMESEAAGGAMADEGAMEDEGMAMPQELPEGVTAAMIETGETVYGGAGICASCHGPNGQGIPNLGANLTDSEWLHSDGSYEGIVETVMNGVTAQESSSGVPMPAKGGSSISDEQARAVSAYVWSLSHGGS